MKSLPDADYECRTRTIKAIISSYNSSLYRLWCDGGCVRGKLKSEKCQLHAVDENLRACVLRQKVLSLFYKGWTFLKVIKFLLPCLHTDSTKLEKLYRFSERVRASVEDILSTSSVDTTKLDR